MGEHLKYEKEKQPALPAGRKTCFHFPKQSVCATQQRWSVGADGGTDSLTCLQLTAAQSPAFDLPADPHVVGKAFVCMETARLSPGRWRLHRKCLSSCLFAFSFLRLCPSPQPVGRVPIILPEMPQIHICRKLSFCECSIQKVFRY